MPCTMDEGDVLAFERETNKKVIGRALDDKDMAIAVACAACRRLSDRGIMPQMAGWVQKWWKEHQRIDKLRAEEARDLERRKKLAKQARSKLTKEEYEALGI